MQGMEMKDNAWKVKELHVKSSLGEKLRGNENIGMARHGKETQGKTWNI